MAVIEAFAVATKRPRGRPKTEERRDAVIKVDRALVNMAKLIAAARGMGVSEYFGIAAREMVERDFAAEMKRLQEGK